ncbi:hypothetical protein [Pseudomonas mangiferae]|uniref:Uncharacterized protein n=1 Tax=Pseudomonas mangiferae TaxID=2593654 RepID=A0A553H2D8_9PSED|nr:hypothetical protein [Pseudomonas mangiferae]TRX75918.1 hypothetical protein FM069_05640 [Pseudomonas mangiferae]
MNETFAAYSASSEDPSSRSAVSWGAIFAGAAAAAALSLILILLGAGLGFSAVSPWANDGVGADKIGIGGIVWIALTQIVASGLGGYVAGRLRVKWVSLHHDEVYFRDTAHGFLAWAVATLVTATLVLSATGSLIGGAVKAGTTVAAGAATAVGATAASAADGSDQTFGYYVDTLFRTDRPAAVSDDAVRSEVARIFGKTLANAKDTGDLQLSAEDRNYLAQVVAQRSNLTVPEAEQRVDAVFAQARQAVQEAKAAALKAADDARKVAAWTSLWMFIALLCGAFVGSLGATFGGRQREAVVYLTARDGTYATTVDRR